MASAMSGQFPPSSSTTGNSSVVVHCSDDQIFLLEESLCSQLPFLKKEGDKVTFDFPSVVLSNLIQWISHYSIDGVAKSKMVVPCLFRSFSYVTADEWDRIFFEQLTSGERSQYFIPTINAAEKYNLSGLQEFLCMGLGCKLRGQDDDVKDILGLEHSMDFTEEELMKVSEDYKWFDEAVEPKGEVISA